MIEESILVLLQILLVVIIICLVLGLAIGAYVLLWTEHKPEEK